MNWLDYLVITLYIGLMLGIGYFMREQKSAQSYFVGDRNFGWFSLLLSTMATQLSAISFISAPAFVGLKQGGGMKWLTFEFAVPLAMIFLGTVLTPILYRAGIVSAYELLERRFGPSTRRLVSLLFLFSRSFGTGVAVYTVALILESVFQIRFWETIIIICIVTMLYSLKGGLKVVVYTDVIQMFIKFFGILVCLGFALWHLGGWANFVRLADPVRTQVINFDSWGFHGDTYGFWPMIFGGFVLYASYYGCDQTQVQRTLAARSLAEVRKMYVLNGIVRFIVTLSYCVAGLAIGTLVGQTPGFRALIPASQPDKMLPLFILNYLPNGVIGLVLVAIFAAAMSSLSTNVNAMSAVLMEDYIVKLRPLTERQYLRYSQLCVLFWVGVCMLTAAVAGRVADTVIEAINKIGSVFYGPILATFTLAVLTGRVGSRAMNAGLVAGISISLYLWQFQPQIFYFWWNVFGALTTLAVAGLVTLAGAARAPGQMATATLAETVNIRFAQGSTYYLLAFFVLILGISLSIPYWL